MTHNVAATRHQDDRRSVWGVDDVIGTVYRKRRLVLAVCQVNSRTRPQSKHSDYLGVACHAPAHLLHTAVHNGADESTVIHDVTASAVNDATTSI